MLDENLELPECDHSYHAPRKAPKSTPLDAANVIALPEADRRHVADQLKV